MYNNKHLSLEKYCFPELYDIFYYKLSWVILLISPIVSTTTRKLMMDSQVRWLTRLWQVSAQPLLVTGTTDIKSDLGCHRAIDQDVALGSSLVPDVPPVHQVAAQAAKTGIALVVAWLKDTDMDSGGCLSPRHLLIF